MHAVVIGAGQHHRPRPAVRNRPGKGGATLRRVQRHLVGDRVKPPGFQPGEHPVPQGFLKIDFDAELVGNGARHLNVITGELAAVVVIIEGRVRAIGANDDGAVVVDTLKQ